MSSSHFVIIRSNVERMNSQHTSRSGLSHFCGNLATSLNFILSLVGKKKTCWWWGHIYIFYTFHQLLHSIFSCGINLFAFLCQDRSFTENKVSDLFSKTFHDMFCTLLNDTRKIGQYREARIAIAPIEKSSACPPLDILDPLLNIRKGMAVSPDWYLQRLMWT